MHNRKNKAFSITEVRIIEAATQLFSREGFNGVGTREIARLADVNEATLFRLFARKKDLFWAAVEWRLSGLKMSRDLQSALAHDEDASAVLPQIVEFLVETVVQQPELLRLLYFAALELPGSQDIYREHLGPVFDSISSYFERCAARGVLQNLDASMTTLGLLGMVIAHSTLHELLTGNELPFTDARDAASAYSQFWEKALLQTVPQPCAARMTSAAVAGREVS